MGAPETHNAHIRAHARTREGEQFDVTLRAPCAPIATLRAIAKDLSRLRPDWRDPESYFENRSEIEHALRRLANHLERTR